MYRTSPSPRAYHSAAGIRRTPAARHVRPTPALRPTLRPCGPSFRAQCCAIPRSTGRDAGPSFAPRQNRMLPPLSIVSFPSANSSAAPFRARRVRPRPSLLPGRAAPPSYAFPRVLKFLPRACGIHPAPLPNALVRLRFFLRAARAVRCVSHLAKHFFAESTLLRLARCFLAAFLRWPSSPAGSSVRATYPAPRAPPTPRLSASCRASHSPVDPASAPAGPASVRLEGRELPLQPVLLHRSIRIVVALLQIRRAVASAFPPGRMIARAPSPKPFRRFLEIRDQVESANPPAASERSRYFPAFPVPLQRDAIRAGS